VIVINQLAMLKLIEKVEKLKIECTTEPWPDEFRDSGIPGFRDSGIPGFRLAGFPPLIYL